jgi:hypothetical protein
VPHKEATEHLQVILIPQSIRPRAQARRLADIGDGRERSERYVPISYAVPARILQGMGRGQPVPPPINMSPNSLICFESPQCANRKLQNELS